MRVSVLVVVMAATLTIGCGMRPRPSGSLRGLDVRPGHVITAEYLHRREFATAYQVVEQLRPEFLRARGPGLGEVGVLVYLNGVRLGGIDELHRIDAAGLAEIRYLTALEATMRFGPGHPAGAIALTLATRSTRRK